ncbi:unnamed protein product, partial [Sphacelaria rigidula]
RGQRVPTAKIRRDGGTFCYPPVVLPRRKTGPVPSTAAPARSAPRAGPLRTTYVHVHPLHVTKKNKWHKSRSKMIEGERGGQTWGCVHTRAKNVMRIGRVSAE